MCVCIRRGASVLHFHCGAVFEFLHLYINYSLSVVLYHLYLVLEMDGTEFLFFFSVRAIITCLCLQGFLWICIKASIRTKIQRVFCNLQGIYCTSIWLYVFADPGLIFESHIQVHMYE